MKANEINSQAVMFVKKFGWDAAIDLRCGAFDLYNNDLQILNGMVCSFSDNHFLFDLVDLKRLIESYELVGRYGAADEAKEYLPMLRMDSYDELKQAIADVESCQ